MAYHEYSPSPDAFVTVIFWGLMGFCYNTEYDQTNPVCEVGFHPNHNLQVWIYKKSGTNCQKIFSPPDLPANIQEMTLKVAVSGTKLEFFQKDNKDFDRVKGDEHDFRWLPDFDGPDFYPEPYGKNKKFKTRLYLSNGTFYTRQKTNSTFQLVDAKTNNHLKDFGHVAMYMAAAINVKGVNDSVSFQIDQKETVPPLKQEPGVSYEIVFRNECDLCPPPDIYNQNEVQRNDFHFNREVVKVPSGRIKYALMIDTPGDYMTPNFCHEQFKPRFNDEAPCAGAGYGQTTGFP